MLKPYRIEILRNKIPIIKILNFVLKSYLASDAKIFDNVEFGFPEYYKVFLMAYSIQMNI